MERNIIMSLKGLLPVFGAALVLASCAEDVQLPQTEDLYALKLESVSLDEGGTSTRALLTEVNAVGLYLTKSNHTEYGSNPRCVYTKTGGIWSAGAAPLITVANGGDAVVYSFHPSGLTVTHDASGNHTVPVSVAAGDDFLATSQTDYLVNYHHGSSPSFGPSTVQTSFRVLGISLKHTLAKVSLRVLKSEAATEQLTLKKVEILSPTNRIQTGNGVMNLSSGVLSGLSSASKLTLTGSTVLATGSSAPNVTCLVAPMAAAEQLLSFRLTVEVLPAGATTPTELVFETGVVGTPQKWEVNKHYVYKVTVDKMGGGFSGVQMDDWQDDASQNTSIGI